MSYENDYVLHSPTKIDGLLDYGGPNLLLHFVKPGRFVLSYGITPDSGQPFIRLYRLDRDGGQPRGSRWSVTATLDISGVAGEMYLNGGETRFARRSATEAYTHYRVKDLDGVPLWPVLRFIDIEAFTVSAEILFDRDSGSGGSNIYPLNASVLGGLIEREDPARDTLVERVIMYRSAGGWEIRGQWTSSDWQQRDATDFYRVSHGGFTDSLYLQHDRNTGIREEYYRLVLAGGPAQAGDSEDPWIQDTVIREMSTFNGRSSTQGGIDITRLSPGLYVVATVDTNDGAVGTNQQRYSAHAIAAPSSVRSFEERASATVTEHTGDFEARDHNMSMSAVGWLGSVYASALSQRIVPDYDDRRLCLREAQITNAGNSVVWAAGSDGDSVDAGGDPVSILLTDYPVLSQYDAKEVHSTEALVVFQTSVSVVGSPEDGLWLAELERQPHDPPMVDPVHIPRKRYALWRGSQSEVREHLERSRGGRGNG